MTTPVPVKRKRGRPKGSKNKGKAIYKTKAGPKKQRKPKAAPKTAWGKFLRSERAKNKSTPYKTFLKDASKKWKCRNC